VSTSGGSSGGGNGSSSGAGPGDAGVSTSNDAGSGHFDAGGTGSGGNPQPTGPLGSCTNPACGTEINDCGCQATDSAGNTVQLGCQAGGQCGCFVNGNLDSQPFDENGTCNDQPSVVTAFLTNCTCQ
jgi:hypothetical protein